MHVLKYKGTGQVVEDARGYRDRVYNVDRPMPRYHMIRQQKTDDQSALGLGRGHGHGRGAKVDLWSNKSTPTVILHNLCQSV